MTRPSKRPKDKNVIKTLRDCILKRKYKLTDHVIQRMRERSIIHQEMIQALCNGTHIPRDDQWNEYHNSWNYKIEGETIDGKKIAAVVAIDQDTGMVVITIFEPKK